LLGKKRKACQNKEEGSVSCDQFPHKKTHLQAAVERQIRERGPIARGETWRQVRLSHRMWWWRSKIKATLVPIGSDRPSRYASLISGFCIPATWTRMIFISSRSTPDAREGHQGQVLPFEAVVVVVVVVPAIADPDGVGAWLVLGHRRWRRWLRRCHVRRNQQRRLLQQRAS
jgi:hypothetical protein